MDLTSVLVQTGYLTIKKIKIVKGKIKYYLLDIPNEEVRISLFENLTYSLTNYHSNDLDDLGDCIYESIKNKDTDNLNMNLKALFSEITFDQHKDLNEAMYHSIFSIALKFLGFRIINERPTNIGKVDAILHQKDFTSICEFKYSKTDNGDILIKKAIDSIYDRRYYEPYTYQENVSIIGVGLSNKGIKAKITDLDIDRIKRINKKD
jgi:hypothetical protein